MRKRTLYVGYDGSYVLSWNMLYKKWVPANGRDAGFYYLTTRTKKRPSVVDIDESSGKVVFEAFRLKMYQVIKLKVWA